MSPGASDRSLDILQTSVDLDCGVDRQTERLQERFYRRGHGSDLIEHWWDGGYGVISGDGPREDLEDFRDAMGRLRSDYGIVHFHSHPFDSDERDALLAAAGDPHMVYTAHSAVDDDDADWYKALQFEYLWAADIVTTGSSYMKQRLFDQHQQFLDEYGMGRTELEDKMEIVRNGTDFPRYVDDDGIAERAAYVRRDWITQLSPDAERIILFTGDLSRETGRDDLATAFNTVGREHEDTVMLYTGTDGERDRPGDDTMDAVASCLDQNLRDRVRFTGRVERHERAALYDAADVVFSPTSRGYDDRSFNMAVPEALMMGTPVVTSDRGAPAELFVEPGYALGTDPTDPESVADHLDYILSNPEEVGEQTYAGKQHALHHYTIERVAERWITDIYGSLVTDCRAHTGMRAEDVDSGNTSQTSSTAPHPRSANRRSAASQDAQEQEQEGQTPDIDLPDAGPMIEPDAVYEDAVDTINAVLGRGTIRRRPTLDYHLLLDDEIERMYKEEGRVIFAEYFPDADRIAVYAPPLKVETYAGLIASDPAIQQAHEAFEADELFDAPVDKAGPILQDSLLQDVYGLTSSREETEAFFEEMYEEDPGTIGLNPKAVMRDMMRLGLTPETRERVDAAYRDNVQYSMEHELLHKHQIGERIPMDVGEAVSHAWDLARRGALGTREGNEVLLANLNAPSYREYAPDAPERGKEVIEQVPRSGEKRQLRELARYQQQFAGEGSGRKRPGIGTLVSDLVDPGGVDAFGGASTGSPVADFILDSLFE